MTVGEYTVEAVIEIKRPVEQVWAFVADPRNDPQWCGLVPEVTLTDQSIHRHPRYSFVQVFGPIQRTGSGEVVSVSAPTELHGRAEVMSGEFQYEYQREPVDGGTRFIQTNHVRWSGPMRLMHPIQKLMTRRIMDRQLQSLKQTLEKKRN